MTNQKIIAIRKVIEGVEVVYQEVKSPSNRVYLLTLIINDEDFKKIKKEFGK